MLLTSTVASHLPSCWYHIPNHLNIHQHHIQQKRKFTTLSLANADTHIPLTNFFGLSLPHTHNNCNKGQENSNRSRYNSDYSNHNHKHHLVLFTNMWWVDVKAAVGQRINLEAILCSTMVILKDPKFALPHISVPDIRYIDWAELRRKGFKGVVFDKDNTITAPYSLTPWPSLESSLERCKSEFGHDIAIFSNSAGLYEYDHDGSKARMLEGAIGIKVIRHRLKKPAGTAEEVEKHFGCESSKLIMVGDRPFTDIVYGNRNGFLTILTEPLSLAEEPFIVKQVRKLETSFVTYWSRRGLKPLGHQLLPDPMRCVKEPRPIFKS
ncbi:phosphatidylglycerophosphate phosphatase 1, chloroplastic/mitochondrial-like [Gastrolobium bilobum]|uniref:phosphatidylglycerophosphate phosphatase 1, chloroplastic/mitochondrial-like n=1 Tax=Gastrolobium bilobum TaxID=150636 RepID=UPI002AB28669|nr:phosphatidylglycerophosphate phosphatase 1, chloroplastic/mitochondrial-like [Gastrolobium bilobum]